MIIYLICALTNEFLCLFFCRFYLLSFQQCGYKYAQYFRWLKNNILPKCKEKPKIPLKYTKRIIRLYIAIFAVSLFVPFFFLPLTIVLANIVNIPIEKLIARYYLYLGGQRLKGFTGIKIGITGSYGKTSVKNILATLLSEKYKVMATPKSFNTPLGICRVAQDLNNSYQVFIAEMGAKNVGDIKELCNLVNPNIGVITGINNQHLESFKSIENTIKTKNELFENLTEKGKGFFSVDNKYSKMLFNKFNGEKYSANTRNSLVYSTNISYSNSGTKFMLNIKGYSPFEVNISFLGKHNVQNICLAISIALKLNLTVNQIKKGLKKLKPIEHRLMPIKISKDLTIIDDAYNSNIDGAIESINVLKSLSGYKVCVTPGIVELGKEQYKTNFLLGKKLNEIDKVIIVGENNRLALYNGLINVGKDKKNIVLCRSLQDAKIELQKILINRKAVVLFENDLPDCFN